MEKSDRVSAKIIRNALEYVDGFACPERIDEESEGFLSVVPGGSVLWGEVRYYIRICGDIVEVSTSRIFEGLELNHPFFFEIKTLCIAYKIGYNSDIDKGVTLSFRQKILTDRDVRSFILRVYDLGRILRESNNIFKNQQDLVEKFYSQLFLKIGPYKKTIILDREVDAFIGSSPFSAECATIPDKDGFFDIQLGDTLTCREGETAHESIKPYVMLLGRDISSAQTILLPWAIIDWRRVEVPSVPTVWDGSDGGRFVQTGVVWKDLDVLKSEMDRVIHILDLIIEDKEEFPDLLCHNLTCVIKMFEKFRNDEHIFLSLKSSEFSSVLTEIRDIIEDYLGLRWSISTHGLTWQTEFKVLIFGDHLAPEQESEIIDTTSRLYKSTYEIEIGLKWAERFFNKIVLWLASIHVKENIRDQNLNFSTIKEEYAVLEHNRRKIVTTKDIMSMSSIELKNFISNIFKKARFTCQSCSNHRLTRLNIYKTQQGFIFSCPECGSKSVRSNFIFEATITQSVFVIDTSALIEGIASELVTQGILDIPLYAIPRAVEFELQRLRKSNKRNEGKKGLEELVKLRKLDDERRILLKIDGNQPNEEMIRISREWKIGLDSLIIEMAKEYSGTIITCDDEDLAPLAIAEGIRTLVYKS